ncbi:MAG: hypothetical protein EZS28_014794, partial [Streblomastix strix]
NTNEHIKFWLGFSTACGPFNQIAICKDSQKLWDASIYAREQAIIASNSLTDQCTTNSVTVSPLENILQDLKVVQLNRYYPVDNTYLAYAMIPPEKPDIIYLKNRTAAEAYNQYNIRLVSMEGKPNTTTIPTATISAIIDMKRNQRFIDLPTQYLRTQSSNYPSSNIADGGGFIQTVMSFTNIISMFVTFAMSQYHTWFFALLFKNIDLIIDQRHVIPNAYPALTQDVCGQIFDCFVDQDVISASSDLYHLLTFQNQHIDDKNYPYGIETLETQGQLRLVSNIFYETTLNNSSKAVKTFYPNKFMLVWKLAIDDLFMRGYNSSKIGVRTNIQITKFTPLTHYLCDGVVRIMFDDNPDLQVLSLEVIGEIGRNAIRSG